MTAGRTGAYAPLALAPVGVAVLLALTALALSLLPYEVMKAHGDALAVDSSSDRLTPALFASMVTKLRLAGALLLAVGVVLYAVRRQVEGSLVQLATSAVDLAREGRLCLASELASTGRSHALAFLALLALAVVLRVGFLGLPMRTDEAFTFTRYASKPLWVGLANYSAPNNHIFHTLLVHLAYVLLGSQPWALRLPALLAGVLVVPATYLCVRAHFDKQAALLAAGLVAASSPLVEYSTNARGYTLVTLFFLASLALAAYLKRSENLAGWLLLAILLALGLYTIPTMLYACGTVALWLLVALLRENHGRRRWLLLRLYAFSLLAIAFLTLLLYAPVIVAGDLRALVGNRYVVPQAWDEFVRELPAAAGALWAQWQRDVPPPIAILLGVGFLTSLVAPTRVARRGVPLALAAMAWCVPVLLAQQVVPYTRVWLFLLPLYLGLAAGGVAHLLQGLMARARAYEQGAFAGLTLGLALVLSVSIWQGQSIALSEETGTLRAAEQITLFLRDYLRPGDRVVAVTPSLSPLEYYFTLHGLPLEYLLAAATEGERALIVVKEPEQTLSWVLAKRGLATAIDPRLLRRFDGAALYELGGTGGTAISSDREGTRYR